MADYTLAETVSTRIPNSPRLVRGAPNWCEWLQVLPDPRHLAARSLGTPVTDHRSSWVRRLPTTLGDVFIKTYQYDTWVSRLRDFCRRTGPGTRSRAAREFDALEWMRNHDLSGPEPLAVLEVRVLEFLAQATLLTTAFPGESVADLMPRLARDERTLVAAAIGKLVGKLHALGFRDGNLDLRNLLAQRTPGGWTITKIDSPRHCLRSPAAREDALVRADWTRLLPQLEPFDVAEVVRAAAHAAACGAGRE